MYSVYCIENPKGITYIGKSTDIIRRCRQHNGELKGGAKFTRNKGEWKLVFAIQLSLHTTTINEADYTDHNEICTNNSNSIMSQIESKIKKYSTKSKYRLISPSKHRKYMTMLDIIREEYSEIKFDIQLFD